MAAVGFFLVGFDILQKLHLAYYCKRKNITVYLKKNRNRFLYSCIQEMNMQKYTHFHISCDKQETYAQSI